MSDEVVVEKTPEQIEAEKAAQKLAEKQERQRIAYEKAMDLFRAASQIKGVQKEIILKSVSGQPGFKFTDEQWKAIVDSQELPAKFVEELRDERYDFTKKYAEREASEGPSKEDMAGFRNIYDIAFENDVCVNEPLRAAGLSLRSGIVEFMKANKAANDLLKGQKLQLMFYMKKLKEEETPSAEGTLTQEDSE